MKKLLLLVILALAIWGIWRFSQRALAPEITAETPHTTTAGHVDIANATFKFDDGPITLKNGSALTPIADGEGAVLDTFLTDAVGYGDINNDGKEDAAAVLIQSSGGSGVFVYIAAYVSGPLGYKSTNTVFVGDRVTPKTISIKGNTITLVYYDRKPDEPLAAEATILTTKQYLYSPLDNSIEEK